MPSSSFDDVNAKCPFYSSSKNERIICEGITDECISILRFENKKCRNRYRARYCDTHYERCSLYKALEDKYEKK